MKNINAANEVHLPPFALIIPSPCCSLLTCQALATFSKNPKSLAHDIQHAIPSYKPWSIAPIDASQVDNWVNMIIASWAALKKYQPIAVGFLSFCQNVPQRAYYEWLNTSKAEALKSDPPAPSVELELTFVPVPAPTLV